MISPRNDVVENGENSPDSIYQKIAQYTKENIIAMRSKCYPSTIDELAYPIVSIINNTSHKFEASEKIQKQILLKYCKLRKH